MQRFFWHYAPMLFAVPLLVALFVPPQSPLPLAAPAPLVAKTIAQAPSVPAVPFYSQFSDITSPKWQKVGCGIASLGMIIGYYSKDDVSIDSLLAEGIKAGAYSPDGWTYAGLIGVAKKHGMKGAAFDLGGSSTKAAYAALTKALASGPVIASVHYKFEPTNPIPHLVVITAVKDGVVYYNDPAAKSGAKHIALDTFLASWKKRYIIIRPISDTKLALASDLKTF